MTKSEAIKVLNMVEAHGSLVIKAKEKAIEALEQEPRWIPVSERLPKEGKTVLVCYQSQGGVAQSVCEWFDIPNDGIVWSTLCGKEPIAWMPLPEPYKAESEDKEKKE